jgi:hypothetical protein
MPIISALQGLRQEDHKFEDSLGYIMSFRTASAAYPEIFSKKI